MTAPKQSETQVEAVPRPSSLRTVIELGVCLLILVALFRTFLAGGYMIETGSMAPCLLGYHRQVTCPACRYPFAVEGSGPSLKAVCPNCGKGGIAVERLARNDGDHLLVHRAMYEYRRPRHWEVVVFRNPNKPTQAYVKRLIALPGESVQIADGDIYIGGEIQAKSYATQRGIRIPVYDHDFRPSADDPDWQPRWVPEGESWSESDGGFHHSAQESAGEEKSVAWVNYRHWVRSGPSQASVPLARWPDEIERSPNGFGTLDYEEDDRLLVCRSALSSELRDELLAGTEEPEFRRAIERLYDASHVGRITDVYGYDRGREGSGHEVRDLMFSADVRLHEGTGEFIVAISDGTEELHCVFDLERRSVRLIDSRTGRAMRKGRLDPATFDCPLCVEFSLMDHQALVAIGGKLPFEPWSYPASEGRGPSPQCPVRFGARGAGVDVNSLKLFRDVYYTDDIGRRAIDAPLQLRADEYFVLGDNSPVSKDSRSWSEGTRLTSEMFLGKPLVVHLPSRKQRFRIGNWQTEIRIPELSRIRYIR